MSGTITATFEDLDPPNIDDGNTGLTSFSPYLGLNYQRFSAIDVQPEEGRVIFYTLSRITSAVGSLIDLLPTSIPLPVTPPAILPAAPAKSFDLDSFDFGCVVRGLAPMVDGVIGFDCEIQIIPIRAYPSDPQQATKTCTYTAPTSTGSPETTGAHYKRCNVGLKSLKEARFLTTPIISEEQCKVIGGVLDGVTEAALVTAMDNVTYSLEC
ncbi:uncharacterized protein BCR38DRAFT_422481 [Pseudomassariella vexata]|uniref:Uncharacterized protein n=1 Tax=Pseudomassariella vexata TaxID=1141098 RepID=A0A1Y2EA91_9PEZI|nr:uncharacterized protein BCR38DRAFT_422481 [Pseudomassariella vexata]ORY68224.1 hypothetical protein BCR38DRAFT_422481 [Pseudomassariella vexata]